MTIAKKQKAKALIADESDFKSWRLMRPNESKLLKEIVYRWRGSSIRVPGESGKWTVWPIKMWCEWTRLSSDKVERALPVLELDGLIRREQHRFGGRIVRAFIQPTDLALAFAGRPYEQKAAKAALAGTNAGIGAGTDAGTDYTSFPSSNTYSTLKAPSSFHEEGKEKAHAMKEKKKPHSKAVSKVDLVGGDPEMLEKIKVIKKSKMAKEAKRAALLELMPVIDGLAEFKVWHPSEKHPNWHSWSPALHLKRYAKYCEYAANAEKASGSKKSMFGTSAYGMFAKYKKVPPEDFD